MKPNSEELDSLTAKLVGEVMKARQL